MSSTATRLRQLLAARAAQAAREAAKAETFKARPPHDKHVRVLFLLAKADNDPRGARVARLLDAASTRMPGAIKPTHGSLPLEHWA
jgi:hypothetical protein